MWYYLFAIVSVLLFIKSRCKQFINSMLWRGTRLVGEYPEVADLPSNVVYKYLPVMGGDFLGVYHTLPVDPEKPVMVYCHGTMTVVEEQLHLFHEYSRAYNVVMFDYRGFGRSTGSCNATVVAYDIASVYDYAIRVYGKVDVLAGSSLGSNAVMGYLKRIDFNTNCVHCPSTIVLIHPFFALSESFSLWGIYSSLTWMTGDMDVRDVVPDLLFFNEHKTDLRVVIIGTPNDAVTPFKCAREVVQSCRGDPRVKLIAIGGQHFSPTPDLYRHVCSLFSREPVENVGEQPANLLEQVPAGGGDSPLGVELVQNVEERELVEEWMQLPVVGVDGVEKVEQIRGVAVGG